MISYPTLRRYVKKSVGFMILAVPLVIGLSFMRMNFSDMEIITFAEALWRTTQTAIVAIIILGIMYRGAEMLFE